MECWICERPAAAVCKFCGRAVCKDHARTLPHIMGVYRGGDEANKAIVVPDAVWCGQCHPRDDPVELDSLT